MKGLAFTPIQKGEEREMKIKDEDVRIVYPEMKSR